MKSLYATPLYSSDLVLFLKLAFIKSVYILQLNTSILLYDYTITHVCTRYVGTGIFYDSKSQFQCFFFRTFFAARDFSI